MNLAVTMLEGIFQKCIQAFFEPIKDLFGYFTASPDVIQGFKFVDILYEKLQVIGAALLILIVIFQSFKAKFAFLGFECEETWRIGGRALVFGFLIGYAKDIAFVGLTLFNRFISYLWGAMYSTVPDTGQFKTLIMSTLIPNVGMTLFSWNAVIFIYLCYKLIKLAFRFSERLMNTALLVMSSPLGFAAGVAQQHNKKSEVVPLGKFAGFDMDLKYSTITELHEIIIKGKCEYDVTMSVSDIGNITRIENALHSIEERLAKQKAELEQIYAQQEVVKKELEKPFAYQNTLNVLVKKQGEINAMLDLDKHEVNAVEMEGAEPEMELEKSKGLDMAV